MHKIFEITLITIVLIMFSTSTPVYAVKTVYTLYNTEEQFKTGDPNGVTITSTGTIQLSYQTEAILTRTGEWTINDIIQIDDQIYLATSGQGTIYQLPVDAQPDCEPVAIYGDQEDQARHIFSLGRDEKNQLLAGTGGAQAQLIRFDSRGKPTTIWSSNEIKYIWSIVTGPAGRIYLATGPTGKIITLDPDGANEQVLYQAGEKNILTLVLDPQGRLYAGGDEFGLIYRIDPSTSKATIIYDTGHKEISRLVLDNQGVLYAATSDMMAAKIAGRLVLADQDDSRPENGNAMYFPPVSRPTPAVRISRMPPRSNNRNGNGDQEGNEIFKIDPQGFVTSIFKQAVTIHCMALDSDQSLLIGIGDYARLIHLNPQTRQAAVVFENPDCSQITALLAGKTTLLGLSNPFVLVRLGCQYQPNGYYLSQPCDAEQVSRWGLIQIQSESPDQTRLLIQTRTGNTADPEKGGWQDWGPFHPVERLNPVTSAPGRFLQYKLLFETTNPAVTPSVSEVKLASQIPNLAPLLKNLSARRPEPKPKQPEQPNPANTIVISWQAEDQNDDDLLYNLYIRALDSDCWILLEKDIEDLNYTLDGLTLADGHYDLKVEACDRASNPSDSALTTSRISQPLIIDNTAPEILQLNWQSEGDKIRIDLQAQDQLSVIESLDYVLDSSTDWQKGLPVDGIFDNTREDFKLSIQPERNGRHFLTIRLRDTFGNSIYRNLTIEL